MKGPAMITPTLMLLFLPMSWLLRCPMFLPTNQLSRLEMREELWGMKGGLVALIHIISWRTVH